MVAHSNARAVTGRPFYLEDREGSVKCNAFWIKFGDNNYCLRLKLKSPEILYHIIASKRLVNQIPLSCTA